MKELNIQEIQMRYRKFSPQALMYISTNEMLFIHVGKQVRNVFHIYA